MFECDPVLLAEFEEAEASVEPWLVGIAPLELSMEVAEPAAGVAGCAVAQTFTMTATSPRHCDVSGPMRWSVASPRRDRHRGGWPGPNGHGC